MDPRPSATFHLVQARYALLRAGHAELAERVAALYTVVEERLWRAEQDARRGQLAPG